jgi:hypothetical protein
MPSGWETYYIVFLAAALSLGIPLVLGALSFFFTPAKRVKSGIQIPSEVRSERSELSRRMNTRFFLGANASLILVSLALMLIPCLGYFREERQGGYFPASMWAIISISLFIALGLLYSARKNDLSWQKSFRERATKDGGS